MANTINYAEKWQTEIIKTLAESVYSAAYITQNVNWLNAKTFHFTTLSTGGYGTHSRAGGWNESVITQTDVPFTLTHDRDVQFLVDKADVDESNMTASVQNVTEVFTTEHQAPETDAYFFEKVAQQAIANSLYVDQTGYTVADVFTKLKAIIKNVRRYRQDIEMFVSSDIMDLLERSTELSKRIELTQVVDGGFGVETRVTAIDGIQIKEITDPERFYNKQSYSATTENGEAGFTGDIAEASPLDVVIADKKRVVTVPKISSIYFFEPGLHTVGDGYLYQNRAYWDTFVFPDGTRGIKSIYAAFNSQNLELTSVAGTSSGDTLITLDREIADTTNYSYVYLTDTTVTLPSYGDDLSAWTAWDGEEDITAATGDEIAIAVIDGDDLAITSGKTTVVSAAD